MKKLFNLTFSTYPMKNRWRNPAISPRHARSSSQAPRRSTTQVWPSGWWAMGSATSFSQDLPMKTWGNPWENTWKSSQKVYENIIFYNEWRFLAGKILDFFTEVYNLLGNSHRTEWRCPSDYPPWLKHPSTRYPLALCMHTHRFHQTWRAGSHGP